MDHDKIAAYLDNNADDAVNLVTDDLMNQELSTDDLKALHEAESQGKKRQGVLAPLAKLIDQASQPDADEDAADAGEAKADADTEGADKAARGELPAEVPAWQKPDYTGPLTGEQAMWRHANIKQK